MTHITHKRIVQAGHFLQLFKNDSQFTTPIFRIDHKRKHLQFVIVFKLDNDEAFYVLNRSKLGYDHELKRLKRFTKSTLYQGILSVPLKARQTIQILQVPNDSKVVKDYVTYYTQTQIDEILHGKPTESSDVYDPFRDAHSVIFHNLSQAEKLMSYEDYQGIQDFHPFSVVKDQAYALTCAYKDPIKKKTIHLQLMGWYYRGQQLKISWKPDNQRKARWRSSLVAIDRKTRRYFFQGNIYHEKGTDPVFLEQLTFTFHDSMQNSRAAKAEFARFINAIKKQKRAALLKLR